MPLSSDGGIVAPSVPFGGSAAVYDPVVSTVAPARLRRNLFPADVTLNGDLFARSARVVVLDDLAVVYTAQEQTITEVARYPITDAPEYSPLTNWSGSIPVETPEGTLYVNRARGCGCHSPLKTMDLPVDL